MADRNVTIRLDVKPGSGFDEPLKLAAKQAREAAAEVEKLGKAAGAAFAPGRTPAPVEFMRPLSAGNRDAPLKAGAAPDELSDAAFEARRRERKRAADERHAHQEALDAVAEHAFLAGREPDKLSALPDYIKQARPADNEIEARRRRRQLERKQREEALLLRDEQALTVGRGFEGKRPVAEMTEQSAAMKGGMTGRGLEGFLKQLGEFDRAMKDSGRSAGVATRQLTTGFGTTVKAVGMTVEAIKLLEEELKKVSAQERQAMGAGAQGPVAPGATLVGGGPGGLATFGQGVGGAAGGLAAATLGGVPGVSNVMQAMALARYGGSVGMGGAARFGAGLGALPLAASAGFRSWRDSYDRSFDRNKEYRGEEHGYNFRESVIDKIPYVGDITSSYARNNKKAVQEENAKNAEEAARRRTGEAHLKARRDDEERALTREQSAVEASLKLGADFSGKQVLTQVVGRQGIAREQDRAVGKGGYSREAEQADIGRRGQYQISQEQLQLEGQRRLREIDAGLGVGKAQEADLQKQYDQARKDSERQRGLVQFYSGGKGAPGPEEKPIFDPHLRRAAERAKEASPGGQNDRQFQEQSAKLQEMVEKERILEGQLAEAKQRSRDMEIQKTQELLQLGRQKLELMQQEHGALTGIIQQEKQRVQGAKESFGLQLPHQKDAILRVSRKLRDKQSLTTEELEYAKGHSDLFGPHLKRIGDKMAGPEWEEVKKNLGLDERQKQAERQELKLSQDIKIQIDANGEAVGRQLADQILPKFKELMEQVKQAFSRELLQLQLDMAGGKRPATK
jgi:hypothetical protein